MIPKEFSEFFNNCNQCEQQKIIDELLHRSCENESLPLTSDQIVMKCPHCQSRAIRGNGHKKGMQRYVCNDCLKNFSESTGKFWFALKKRHLLFKYMHCLISGYSIRKSALLTGISIQTSFDWRHKLLTSCKPVLPDGFRGIVEMKDLLFDYSEKGKRRKEHNDRNPEVNEKTKIIVMATCDRNGSEDLRVVAQGSLTHQDIFKTLEGRVQNADILISPGTRNQIPLNEKIKLEIKDSFSNKNRKKAESNYHINNVHYMYTRLFNFMNSFHGVATKYLQNYMNWFLVLERISDSTRKLAVAGNIALASDRAWYDFKKQNINTYLRT